MTQPPRREADDHRSEFDALAAALEALRASEAAHRALLAALPVIVYWVSPTPPYDPIYVSPGTNDLGYTREEWNQPLWLRILHPDDRDRVLAETEAAFAERRPLEYEYRVIAKDGSVRWIHDRGAFVQDDQGRTVAWHGVLIDITERRALEERLAALSQEDELTGLLNRRGFRRMADQALKVEGRSGRRTALLYFDLDGLKPINDRYGHAEGDRALRTVADVLRSGVRQGDLVARVGGDEFVVLAPGIGSEGEGARLAERLQQQLAEEHARAGRPYRLGFSVGVAEDAGVIDLAALLDRADAALYESRAARGLQRVLPEPADRPLTLDHLVYVTPDLQAGVDAIERLVGVRATRGGRHPGRGTHNALLSLGRGAYLEIIAPDPEQPAPAAARPFGLDDVTSPRLVTWSVKSTDLEQLATDARRMGITLGAITAGSRRRDDAVLLSWRYTNPNIVVADGLVPFFIDWGDTPHPSATAAQGVTLAGLHAEHPEPATVRQLLTRLGLNLRVEAGPRPALVASFDTPRGRVELR